VLGVERNAWHETLEVVHNSHVDAESYQLLVEVDHKHEMMVEVDPLLLKDDYLVEHHTFHVMVEQKKDKLNRHLPMMNHWLLVLFCMENKLHQGVVH
jgi:hypothetical protein